MDQVEVIVHADHVDVPERLIVAPVAGVFRLQGDGPHIAAPVEVGQTLGTIERLSGDEDVVSPHAGRLMGLLAIPGERVRDRQPLAWLRVPDAPVAGPPVSTPTVSTPTVPAAPVPTPPVPTPQLPAATVPAPPVPAPQVPAATVPAATVSAPPVPAPQVPAATVSAPPGRS